MITTTEKTTIVTDDWRTITERLAVASHHMYSRERCVFILKIVYAQVEQVFLSEHKVPYLSRLNWVIPIREANSSWFFVPNGRRWW